MSRKPINPEDRASIVVAVRFTPREKRAMDRLIEQENRQISQLDLSIAVIPANYLRNLLRREAKSFGFLPETTKRTPKP